MSTLYDTDYELLITFVDREGILHLADGKRVDLLVPRRPVAVD